MTRDGRIAAVLGPTNTGKTHYAIERMLGHRTGVIGLPLRLLAREVYDRILRVRGPSVVALVTGEERIVPERTAYWVCTVEAMPDGMAADFLAVDEIQLCADLERGHVFTDRLLRSRGLHETLFLGSDTMRGAIAALVPGVQFLARERFSNLSYTGAKKISRMKARSAIVGFSVENVYAIAELIRRQKGGAAVVMGALSPRTRNAQVELYQNGDVDFLVATDAIGMGLNLDIDHVAFSSVVKFDGRRMRTLLPNELAQIAGRAGRHMTDGSFGVTGEARPLPEDVVEAITNHRFTPVRKLQWRNARLEFGSVGRLIASLEAPTDDPWLSRAREADDLQALRALAELPEVRERAVGGAAVRLLWDVCRIPDFRGISAAEHAGLLERIYGFLAEWGRVPDDWLGQQVQRIDRTDGDIDTLSKRLAFIRTWTYVAQRQGWVDDEMHWRGATRAVEDRLSDALHGALTQRFVDRRTSVLLRRLKQKEGLVAEVNDKGEVSVEAEFVGRLEGFRFRQDASGSEGEARTLRNAGFAALKPELTLRADRFYNAPDTELDYTEQGGLMWGEHAVGKLVTGPEPLRPGVQPFVDEEAGPEIAAKVQRRLQHFIDRRIGTLFEPLLALARDEALSGLARGFAFRLVEALGVLPRDSIAAEVKELDQEARAALRRHGVRFGQFTIFLPALLKPAATRLRLVLWSLAKGLAEFPESPPPGLVTIPAGPAGGGGPEGYFAMAGYRAAGTRAIRIDMLERLADLLRPKDSRAGFEATPDMLSITGMTLEQFADLMAGLGYRAVRGERPKQRPVAPAHVDAASATPSEASAAEGAAAEGGSPASKADDVPFGGPGNGVEPGPVPGEPSGRAPEAGLPNDDASAVADAGAPPLTGGDAVRDVVSGGEVATAPDLPRTETRVDAADGETRVDAADGLERVSPAATGTGAPGDAPGLQAAEEADGQGGDAGQVDDLAEAARAEDAQPAAMAVQDAPGTPSEVAGEPAADAAIMPEGVPAGEERVANAPAGGSAADEAEVFFTFTWAGRAARHDSGGRPERNRGGRSRGSQGAQIQGDRSPDDRAMGERGGGERGGGEGGRGRGNGPKGDAARGEQGKGGRPHSKGPRRDDRGPKGKPSGDEAPKTYEARPPKKDRIDPDNPFAAALMGLKLR